MAYEFQRNYNCYCYLINNCRWSVHVHPGKFPQYSCGGRKQFHIQNGDSVQIVLKDDYRNVYPNEEVHIKILADNGWGNNYDVVTDNQGEASVVLSTYENGNYTIHTNYNGTLFNKEYHGVDQLVIDDGYGY